MLSWAATIASPSVRVRSCVSGTGHRGEEETSITVHGPSPGVVPLTDRKFCSGRHGFQGNPAKMLALKLQGSLPESQTLTWRQIHSVSSRCVVGGLSRTLSSTQCVQRRDEESAFIASAVMQGACLYRISCDAGSGDLGWGSGEEGNLGAPLCPAGN